MTREWTRNNEKNFVGLPKIYKSMKIQAGIDLGLNQADTINLGLNNQVFEDTK